jgi:hypothetical protein
MGEGNAMGVRMRGDWVGQASHFASAYPSHQCVSLSGRPLRVISFVPGGQKYSL